jgi:tetratricopeptide (TPR) repeat protein
MRLVHVLSAVLGLVALGACVTPTLQGEAALRQGRYADAAARFEETLANDPGRLDGLIGLGISKYKLGDFVAAAAALEGAVARAPGNATARLYLGLASLQAGQDGPAEEHLQAFIGLGPEPRVAAHADRVLRMLRREPPTAEMRGFLAASLEDQAQWASELRATTLALRDEQLRRLTDDRIIFLSGRRCHCF